MFQGLNRASFSFVALLVINPLVILFYQNCSLTPIGQARQNYQSKVSTPLRDQYLASAQQSSNDVSDRTPASVSNNSEFVPASHSTSEHSLRTSDCLPGKEGCQNYLSE